MHKVGCRLCSLKLNRRGNRDGKKKIKVIHKGSRIHRPLVGCADSTEIAQKPHRLLYFVSIISTIQVQGQNVDDECQPEALKPACIITIDTPKALIVLVFSLRVCNRFSATWMPYRFHLESNRSCTCFSIRARYRMGK